MFLLSNSTCSLPVYKKATDFWVSTLHPAVLLSSLISSRSFGFFELILWDFLHRRSPSSFLCPGNPHAGSAGVGAELLRQKPASLSKVCALTSMRLSCAGSRVSSGVEQRAGRAVTLLVWQRTRQPPLRTVCRAPAASWLPRASTGLAVLSLWFKPPQVPLPGSCH